MTADDFGANSGLIDELFDRYLENPEMVPERWRRYFAEHPLDGNGEQVTPAAEPVAAPVTPPPSAAAVEPAVPDPPVALEVPTAPEMPEVLTPPPLPAPEPQEPPERQERNRGPEEHEEPLRGVWARIAENMEASLEVPTATSARTVPAKLLEVNRQILNNHLDRTGGGKVSFTHLIAFAVLQALRDFPGLNCAYHAIDDAPGVVRHSHVNLGLAVDVERPGQGRALLVPNVKCADTLDFDDFWRAYEETIERTRNQTAGPDDFAGTTATITNPGMLGTVHSVPRLMPGQGFIVGVGAIGYPAEYEAADPHTLAQVGVGKVTTLTNTYDHRVISGAESGEFLGRVHDLLLGTDDFYDHVFQSLSVPYEPARWYPDEGTLAEPAAMNEKTVRVHQLVNMYRVRGHLIANLDPLGRREPRTHPELDIAHHGLSIWDLDREFPVGSLGAGRLERTTMPLRDILGVLRDAYARTVGVEYMHIQEPDQKDWIRERIEVPAVDAAPDDKRRILDRLTAAEAFERFLHTKYLGHKRFSLEGAETLIPMLDALFDAAADDQIREAVMGMAHRGRLNVLANVIGKPHTEILREFEDEPDPTTTQGSGDVKYHLGAAGTHASPAGNEVVLRLAANPSHLEAVGPVVEGMARALADHHGDPTGGAVLPVLVHGDAAFAGQGVVAETFNLSQVEGYDVGGTVHIVVNNQLGFTTTPESGRSSVYATDVAKMVQAPIFHVNGDDPEAAARVTRLAFAFRQAFRKDVVVDLVCYRRWGHNETDEPAFTQPVMYALIEQRPSVRARYVEQLVSRGDAAAEECDALLAERRVDLDVAFTSATGLDSGPEVATPVEESPPDVPAATAIDRSVIDAVVNALTTWPDGFHVHPKLERNLLGHRVTVDHGEVDWVLAEACALGSMMIEGTPVRLAGQDTRRGTFSQRHGVLVDSVTESEYVPLAHVRPDQAPYRLYDSVLSEYAALGFEYGYSVADPDAFVAWEAQFGDFANAAQIVIDQFVVAAGDKWGQHCALTLLLPHGFEGQGPEHSSARLERFLVLVADGNLRVAYPTTAAQYFHLLRRQALDPRQVPLVCLTPKRYLRMPHTRSPLAALTNDGFHPVLDDRSPDLDPESVHRVLVCAGKIAHELMDERDERRAPVSVVRVEQIAPWPSTQLDAALDRYPSAREVWWVQEEPANMGALRYASALLTPVYERADVRVVARPPSPSPATGSHRAHEREQAELLDRAFAGLDA